ncbi:MAG: GNAT family N-acetyltransferase [Sphingomonadales bacterium]
MKWSFRNLDAFPDFAPKWGALNAEVNGSPLLDPTFLEISLQHFSRGGELIAAYGDTRSPAALAIMARTGRFSWQTFQPAQAPLGAWLCRPDLELKTAMADLVAALPGPSLVAAISQQDPDLSARPKDGGSLRTFDYIETARITLPNSFDTYWAARGKNLRHTMKRQRNLLAREGIESRLEIVTAENRMAAAVKDYGALESRSWKADEGGAIHASNLQGRFYTALMQAFSRHNRAAVYRYWYDDRLVASDLCIHDDRVFIILKTTYDGAEKKTSPAHLMRQESFRKILADRRFKTIEFYGRAMDWHHKWSDEIRRMHHVNCYRWPVLAVIHGRKLRPV